MTEQSRCEWELLIFGVILEGISAKIRLGIPLSDEQQEIKDCAPQDFKLPEPHLQTALRAFK